MGYSWDGNKSLILELETYLLLLLAGFEVKTCLGGTETGDLGLILGVKIRLYLGPYKLEPTPY